MSNKCFASLIDISSIGPAKPEPALFIKMSILPSIDNTFFTRLILPIAEKQIRVIFFQPAD